MNQKRNNQENEILASELAERMKSLLKVMDLTASAFARRAGLERLLITRIINQVSLPGYDKLAAIFKAFPELNPRWLILGEEPVFTNDPQKSDLVSRMISQPGACGECEEKQRTIADLRKLNQMLSENYEMMKEECDKLRESKRGKVAS